MELEEHIKNLKEYCRVDREIIDADYNAFYDFCRNHVEDIEAVIAAYEQLKKDYKDLEKEISDFHNCWLHKSKIYQEIDRLEMELKLYNKDVDEYNYYFTLNIIEILKRLLEKEE